MAQSISRLQSQIMRDYYMNFSKYSKGNKPNKKVAWVTSFAPIEILEALDILYYYPESYAAVIAASGKEQDFLDESDNSYLSTDCCSYSCCIEGCLIKEDGPRGIPPRPDILIATNNQCNTLPNWWSILAIRYNIPLIIIDYPGEYDKTNAVFDYVMHQHKYLIEKLEDFSGNKLDYVKLNQLLQNSKNSVEAWNNVVNCMKDYNLKPTMLFDGITYLIIARCKPETSELYRLMLEEIESKEKSNNNQIPIYWIGYPLWYHPDRYFSDELKDFKLVGSNYITWWNLNYSGEDVFEILFNAYNYTFLNLSQETRNIKLNENIDDSKAICAISMHNKSCKCDFVSAQNIKIPKTEVEIDMIDRKYPNVDRIKAQIELLKDSICSK